MIAHLACSGWFRTSPAGNLEGRWALFRCGTQEIIVENWLPVRELGLSRQRGGLCRITPS